jgi:diguanylate cyclase (GGDEF)-like protein
VIDHASAGIGGISPQLAAELRQRAGERVPLIFLGQHDDVESRLRAARGGADVYLVKPFDLHELIDQLDRIGIDGKQEPYHIVVVEDSPTQAAYYSAILKKADMVPVVVSDPLRVLDVMNENAADLVLMDMYMPRCNGMELAKVIRQVPRYASIPIVYLSAETELNRQLDAMSLGGDDFLTKPINPSHLIRSVSIRAERARSLRTFMLTDNLTGLLNHARIKEQLQHEVARAERGGGRVAFAMLDIDNFKSVNDTHGHHVGDRVIKTLARMLQQRLRQTDYIGRYGGEEFAVILPDAGPGEAIDILDEIRLAFAKVHQFAPAGMFSVTFSAGVASFPSSRNNSQLALDADKALYAAKRAGRNRIVGYVPELA